MAIASDIKYQHPGVLLLRFTVGILMLFHGVAKLMSGVDGIGGMLAGAGLPSWFAYGALIGEVIAPLLVMAGLWVRWAALLIAINMIFAVFLAHMSDLFKLSESGGYSLELQAFFFFCSLAIAWLADGKTRTRR